MTESLVQLLARLLVLFVFLSSGRFSISQGLEKERTLAIIKPDGLFGNYTDRIKQMVLESHFNIAKEMLVRLDEESAATFYAEHSSKSFFSSLIDYMTSGPVLVMILEKENAISDWRDLIGPTNAREAKRTHPQSIRAMCGLDITNNCVHGSDSHKSAEREIAFFFKETLSDEAVGKHDEL